MLDGLEIWIRQSQQERSRTPDVAMKRDASPFGRRDLTPKREKKWVLLISWSGVV